jgi:hypothetical protein
MKSSTWLKKRLIGRSGESGDDADQSRSGLDVDRQDPEEHVRTFFTGIKDD